MKIALNLIRPNPVYRNDAFTTGMHRLGFQVETVKFSKGRRPGPDDVLLIWNRYGTGDEQARLFEANGAAVIVVENSYLDMKNSKKSFAMSLNRHNGAGIWPAPDYPRLPLLDVVVEPWRAQGTHVLVLPQRGIGLPPVAMPREWGDSVVPRLRRTVKTNLIHVRKHPGTTRTKVPLEEDFKHAWCVVTWGSSAATKALVAGIPVFYEFDQWIAGPAACQGIKQISLETPAHTLMGNREEMLENLAWAQWTLAEVETGEPMERLLALHKRRTEIGTANVT